MKKKTLLLIALVLICLGFGGYRFMYHGHRDVSSEDASYMVSVAQLQKEFAVNSDAAGKKYADKVIEVTGKITSGDAQAHSVMIDGKLSAVIKGDMPAIPQVGAQVSAKGRFVGYDDLLEEMKMDQVTINK